MTASHWSVLFLVLLIPSATAQTVSPEPYTDCTDQDVRIVNTACKAGDWSQCCYIGTSCCGGGCCDALSLCINVGTPNEACCPVTSPNTCGYFKTGTTVPWAVQSVTCFGADGISSYNCPPNATCNLVENGCYGGSSGGGGGGGGANSQSSGSSETATPSVAASTAPSSPSGTGTISQGSIIGASPTETTTTRSSPTHSNAAAHAEDMWAGIGALGVVVFRGWFV